MKKNVQKASSTAAKPSWRFNVEADFIRDESLSLQSRFFYCLLKSYEGGDGSAAYPSLLTLAKRAGCNRETVQKYLRELEGRRLIEKVRSKSGGGKFQSTRYILRGHSGHSPLRKGPTTENAPSKNNQVKQLPNNQTKSKESKASSPSVEECCYSHLVKAESENEEFEPVWKPTRRGSKEEQLRRIRPPDDFPSESDFEDFIEKQGIEFVSEYRDDLYSELCRDKWHQWKPDLGIDGKWVPIRDWKAYICGLDQKIEGVFMGHG